MDRATILLDEIVALSINSDASNTNHSGGSTPRQPLGIPLYRYRIDEGHRDRMQALLRAHCARHMAFDGPTAALFCRYAADGFRHHKGSRLWKWATVTDPIGWRGDYPALVSAVERGLGWWKRRVLTTNRGRCFLATLVVEGGGPLGMLHDESSKSSIRDFLHRLLVECEHFQRPALDMVGLHRSQLPSSLQHDELLTLLAELIDNVVSLRSTLRGDGVDAKDSDPIAALDRSDSHWRDRLVLDLDDDTARTLLKGLLRESAPIQRSTRAVPTIETVLQEGREGWSLRREVMFPLRADTQELLRLFGYTGKPPGRIRVLRERPDGLRAVVATADVQCGESDSYVFERLPGARIDDPSEVCEPVTLVLLAGTRELGCFSPPGGEALGDGPWTFSTMAPHPLFAQGALQTRHASVWVALSEACGAPRIHEGTVWEEIGSLRAPGALRTLHRLEGTVSIPHDRENTAITTGAPAEDDRWYVQGSVWMGPGHFRAPTFRGQPHVYRLDWEGVSHRVAREQIMWNGSQVQQRPCGRGVLEVRHEGRTRLRAPMVIVPDDLSVWLRASQEPNKGTLCIQGCDVITVRIERDPRLEVTYTPDGAVHELTVTRSPESALATLTLTICLKGGIDLSYHVDFPARRQEFVWGFDRALPEGEKCSLERLAQIRAVASSHMHNDRFDLVARVPGKTSWMRLATLPGHDGRSELVLDAVRDELEALLACTNDIDGTVELSIECRGQRPGRKRLQVGRYDRWFEPERSTEGRILRLSQSKAVTSYVPESLRVEARPLLEPQAEPRLLQPLDGCWQLTRAQGFEPGRWMVLAWHRDRLAVRPLCATVPAPSSHETLPAPSGLRAAASFHEVTERAEALDQEFARLAHIPFDPEWRWIDDHLATLHALPASTFDVVHALVRNPHVAVVAFLRTPQEIRWRVWDAFETLPFLWETVPVAAWSRGLQRLRETWGDGGDALDAEGFTAFFNRLFKETNGSRMTLQTQLELAAASIDQPVCQGTLSRAHGNPQFCAQLREWLQEGAIALRQRHDPAYERWPDDDLPEAFRILPNTERLQGHDDAQELVVHGPLLTALWSAGRLSCPKDAAYEDASEPWARLRLALRRARSFDRQWFDEATSYWLTRLFLCSN